MPIKHLVLTAVLAASATANPGTPREDLFSSWDKLPEMIESMQLEKLHRLTLIKLGYPQPSQGLSESEHRLYMAGTRERWQEWWNSTGNEIAKARKLDANSDQEAFRMAWDFLDRDEAPPKTILPVWIPKTWTLHVTFTNGDYMGREREIWTLQRSSSEARLTKLRGDYGGKAGDWKVALTRYEGFSPETADRTLKALCYLYHHAPAAGTTTGRNQLQGLYYPHATLHLLDGGQRIVWNTEGYEFLKIRPEYGDGEAGMSCFFLKTVFATKEKWKEPARPTSQELAPYRNLLSANKPYFFTNAADIVLLFGRVGGHPEKESLMAWAAKQKAATNPKMDWKVRSSDFATEMKVNVISSTKLELAETLAQIKKLEARLAGEHGKQPE